MSANASPMRSTLLVEISKFEAGRIQLEKAAFDVVKLIKKVIFHYQILADEFKVSINLMIKGIQ